MADEDLPDDAPAFRGPPLPPDDRLWRHPSEVRAPASNRSGPSGWGALGAAAAVGASSALLAAWLLGAFGDRVVDRQVVERVATDTAVALPRESTSGTAAVLVELRPVLVSIRAGEEDGTGVVLRDDGHVLTTASLVGSLGTVAVLGADGRTRPAEVVGRDPATDVAVLSVAGLSTPGAVLGTADDLAVGDRALAVAMRAPGAPEVGTGVIGGLSTSVTREDGAPLHGLISTDIVLPGSLDGAALVDERGAVIGVTTRAGGAAGIRAVPIDLAMVVADDIIETGAPGHPWLGVEGDDLSSSTAATLRIAGGAHLLEVVGGSPADRAGLEDEDVVTEVDATTVASMGEMIAVLREHDPGDHVRIGYLRDGHHHWTDVTLAETA